MNDKPKVLDRPQAAPGKSPVETLAREVFVSLFTQRYGTTADQLARQSIDAAEAFYEVWTQR